MKLYEVFNFKGSNFYCSDCFRKHPDSKDWIKKVHTQRDVVEKGSVFCGECQKELSGKPDQTKLIRRNIRRMKNKEKEPESADKRHHRRHLLKLPVEYSHPLAGIKIGCPGFTLNVSEEGLSLDLFDKLEVGQNLKLRLLHATQGSIEIMANIVWISPPPRKGETYRSGMSITKLSGDNQRKWQMLLGDA
jgi:uncharacterized CHY-type Zn-finger protein